MEFLCERGADVNRGLRSSSLHYAACFGRPQIVKVKYSLLIDTDSPSLKVKYSLLIDTYRPSLKVKYSQLIDTDTPSKSQGKIFSVDRY